MSESFNLFRLQQFDLNRMKILRRQKEIEKIIDSDSEVQNALARLEASQDAVKVATKTYDDIHNQV